ncbi:MAG: hypothetical protein ACOX2L_05805 [Anaerolineae bacterium]|jgi:hypothetical protein|nr:hypothetical protein [Chloroflexota bacterium]
MHDRQSLFMLYGRRTGDGSARVDLRMVSFFGVVLTLLALAGWLYLRQASEVAQLASEIRQLELEVEARHREMVVLHGQVAMLGSLNRVLAEGGELGYQLPSITAETGQLLVDCAGDCQPPAVAIAPQTPEEPEGSIWAELGERIRLGLRSLVPTW